MTPAERAELRDLGARLIAFSEEQITLDEILLSNPLVTAAQREISRRRSRRRLEQHEVVGETGWNILFDLYVMAAHGRRVSITSACIASGAPPTTGLRYVSVLEENDLVLRQADPKDCRRAFLRLTEQGRKLVETALRNSMNAEDLAAGQVNPRSSGQNGCADEWSALSGISQQTRSRHMSNILD